MKRICIVLFALFLFQLLYSQTEWAPIGAEWYYSVPDEAGNPLNDYQRYISNRDTLIEGEICRVIQGRNHIQIMCMEDNKVYYRFNDGFRLIYDFDALVGDTISFDFKSFKPNSFVIDTTYTVDCIVDKIDTIIVNEMNLRRYQTSIIQREDLDFLVFPSTYTYTERIGYEYEFMLVLRMPTTGFMTNLRCYSDKDINYITDWWSHQNLDCNHSQATGVAQLNDFDEPPVIYPNPTRGIVKLNLPRKTGVNNLDLIVYDCTGKKVYSSILQSNQETIDLSVLPSGVYHISISDNELINKLIKMLKL